jgi:hypothetical protein
MIPLQSKGTFLSVPVGIKPLEWRIFLFYRGIFRLEGITLQYVPTPSFAAGIIILSLTGLTLTV